MIRTTVTIFIISFFICSCDNKIKNYYEDGSIKSTYNIDSDKIDGIYKEYYETTGEIKILASYKSGLLDGEKKTFHKNGIVKSTENYTSNMLYGDCKYYTNDGKLESIKNYILINPKLYEDVNSEDFYNYIKEVFTDSIRQKKSKLNTVLMFDSNGQVNEFKSHYFEIALKSDTVRFCDSIQAMLVFGYRLNGKKTKYRVIQFANEKMDLYNVFETDNDTVYLSDKPQVKGINYIRGWIDEYTPYGFDTLSNVLIFEKKYFVK